MKYIDIFKNIFGEDYYHFPNSKILAWTANHEHAVFDIQDAVHPATVVVWFQWWIFAYDDPPTVKNRLPKCRTTIYKIEKKGKKWQIAEPRSFGRIPFVNNNPFDPRKENAASNTAASVFPQNISPNIHRQRKKNPPPTPAPEIITKVCYDKDIRRYLVFESSYWDIEQFHLIKVCETEDEADYLVPKFKEGDFVDIPTHGLFNVQIAEIARCVGDDEDIENELSYNIVGVKYTSFKASELEKVQNRGIRTQ